MPPAEPGGPRLTLGRRLSLALLLLAGFVAALLLLWFAPSAEAAFARAGAELLADGSATMHDVARRQTAQSNEVLVDLIRRNTVARERAVRDLPLEALAGAEAIRDAVLDDDAQR